MNAFRGVITLENLIGHQLAQAIKCSMLPPVRRGHRKAASTHASDY